MKSKKLFFIVAFQLVFLLSANAQLLLNEVKVNPPGNDNPFEFIELKDHPFWVGTQAHPEFKSRPDRSHPLFRELIGASLRYRSENSSKSVSNDSTSANATA
jgi:carbamoylphosphate synthase small subunit